MSNYWMMHECGGDIEKIGERPFGYRGTVDIYKCKKCGAEFDSSDYDQFMGYWKERGTKNIMYEKDNDD